MEAAAWFVLWGLTPTLTMAFSARNNAGKKRGAPLAEKMIKGTVTEKSVFGVERAVDIPDDVFLSEHERAKMEEAMPPCEHGWFESSYNSDHQLHYRKWLPSTSVKPKAVVIFMHGIQTHSGKADILSSGRKINVGLQAEMLLNEGMALFAFDMYGHGYSEGKRFWIPSWENNKSDLINFVRLVQKQVDESIPIFLMGESYGCTLTIMAARHFQDHPFEAPKNLDSIILNAPAIIGDIPPRPVLAILVFLAKRYPRWRPFFMINPVSPDRIWRDPEVLKIRSDPSFMAKQIDGSGSPFILGTALNLLNALKEVRENVIPGFHMPFMIFHGTMDFAVPLAGSEFMCANCATPESQRKFIRKEGAYHDLFSDFVAEECMSDVIDWINGRLEERKQ